MKEIQRPETKETLQNVISEVMEKAYESVAKAYEYYLTDKKPESVYLEGTMCQQTSEAAKAELEKHRFTSEYVYVRNPQMFKEYGGRQHIYLLVDNRYLLDGTWHSFLEKLVKRILFYL